MSKPRGRKPLCNAKQRRAVASLVRQYGVEQTVGILADEYEGRPKCFPEPVELQAQTVRNYAKEHGIELDGRGRQPSFSDEEAKKVAQLVRKVGTASRAQEVLAAESGSDAKVRKAAGFPEPLSVSLPTVCRAAKDNGVALSRGRRKAA